MIHLKRSLIELEKSREEKPYDIKKGFEIAALCHHWLDSIMEEAGINPALTPCPCLEDGKLCKGYSNLQDEKFIEAVLGPSWLRKYTGEGST